VVGLVREHRDVVAVVAAGGALGSIGRWGLAEALPHGPGEVAWSTFAVNVTGALLLGFLMAAMADVLAGTRYVRPFLGVGVLGGWTTFSTYMLDTRDLLAAGRVPAGLLLYLGGTLVLGLVAVWLGLVAGRVLLAVGRRRGRGGRS
jgi:CrcB protein